MICKIRILLDVEGDVFRDIVINTERNLEDFHFIIARSFGFKGQEMAAFYTSNQDWEQGREIPLVDMSEDNSASSMATTAVNEVLSRKGDRLIYVYDFFSMWTFFVELIEVLPDYEEKIPFIALSIGQVPDEAPEKEFTGRFSLEVYDDFEDYNQDVDFESLEDMDPDSF